MVGPGLDEDALTGKIQMAVGLPKEPLIWLSSWMRSMRLPRKGQKKQHKSRKSSKEMGSYFQNDLQKCVQIASNIITV